MKPSSTRVIKRMNASTGGSGKMNRNAHSLNMNAATRTLSATIRPDFMQPISGNPNSSLYLVCLPDERRNSRRIRLRRRDPSFVRVTSGGKRKEFCFKRIPYLVCLPDEGRNSGRIRLGKRDPSFVRVTSGGRRNDQKWASSKKAALVERPFR